MNRRRVSEEDWIADPRGGGRGGVDDPQAKLLIARRNRIWVLAVIVDEDRSYEYDEFALIKLGRHYYLLSTTGCSCPSPGETWSIELGPTTLGKIRKHILSGEYDGYTLPGKKRDEFIAAIDEAARRSR